MGIQQLPRRSARDDVLYMRGNVGGGEVGEGMGGLYFCQINLKQKISTKGIYYSKRNQILEQ